MLALSVVIAIAAAADPVAVAVIERSSVGVSLEDAARLEAHVANDLAGIGLSSRYQRADEELRESCWDRAKCISGVLQDAGAGTLVTLSLVRIGGLINIEVTVYGKEGESLLSRAYSVESSDFPDNFELGKLIAVLGLEPDLEGTSETSATTEPESTQPETVDASPVDEQPDTASATTTATTSPPPEEAGGPLWPWLVGGAGAAMVVTGLVLALLQIDAKANIDQNEYATYRSIYDTCQATPGCDPEDDPDVLAAYDVVAAAVDSTNTQQIVGIVLAGVGVAAVTGAILGLVLDSDEPSTSVGVGSDGTGASLFLSGSF